MSPFYHLCITSTASRPLVVVWLPFHSMWSKTAACLTTSDPAGSGQDCHVRLPRPWDCLCVLHLAELRPPMFPKATLSSGNRGYRWRGSCSGTAPSDFVVYMFASSDPTHPPMRYSFATCTATAMGRSCHGNGKFRHLHATFPCRRHL